MKSLHDEILEVPEVTQLCYEKNQGIELPTNVPYLGMGASYNAAVTLQHIGKNIFPYIAAEYYYYLAKENLPLGVLISQSGETSETVWNLEHFEKVIGITNFPGSTLGASPKTEQLLELYAGGERFASVKTYLNTLIVLYLGLGLDPKEGIEALQKGFGEFQEQGKYYAESIAGRIASKLCSALYVVGSGPNMGTAQQAALTLSESTKLGWSGLSASQYDHGPKETARDSVVLFLQTNGKSQKRIDSLKDFFAEEIKRACSGD